MAAQPALMEVEVTNRQTLKTINACLLAAALTTNYDKFTSDDAGEHVDTVT